MMFSKPRGTQLRFDRIIKRNSRNREDVKKALTEWFAIDYHVDPSCSTTCVCTYPNIKRLWVIHNNYTGVTLKWVGDCCVKRIGIPKRGRRDQTRTFPKGNMLLTEMFAPKMVVKQDNNSDTEEK